MRLFLAVNFDDATKHRIQAVQQRLYEAAQGEFSRLENLHLTLAFLGEVPAQRAATVRRAMDRTGVVPLNLTFDQIGFFRRDGGDIWWIGLAENPALLRLQQE
ncbi:MAG: RNA 2',3'-cyclic phosphodiesterase, partial [Faecalispora jeddahensis]